MNNQEKISQFYQQFNTNCPFQLARHLEIHIHYVDFWKHIYGYYSPMLSTAHILINDNVSLEKQEQICEFLIAHHILKGANKTAFCLDQDTYLKSQNNKAESLNTMLRRNVIPFPSK